MRRQAVAQQIRVKEKLSHAEATKVTRWEHQQESRMKQTEANMMKAEKNILVEKKKTVTFIAGNINATAEIKCKTERIQVAVKAPIPQSGYKRNTMGGNQCEQASQESTVYWLLIRF